MAHAGIADGHGRKRMSALVLFVVLTVASIIVILPLYWSLITSFKTSDEIYQNPPTWFPASPTLDNFSYVWRETVLPQTLLNSIIVTIGGCVLTLFLALHAAYASVRFDFRGRNFGLFLLLMTVMIPGVVTLLPQYMVASELNLIDTKVVLILIFSAWQIPLAVWIIRAHLLKVPVELEEAARVDGCSRIGALYRVVLPLSVPGIAAAAIVVIVWIWNEFLIALTLTTSTNAQPLPVGLYRFVSETGVIWGQLTAGALIALVPPVVLFVILQRQFVQGLTAGAGR